MIKVISGELGIRLFYNDIEVFNHSEALPCLKRAVGKVRYGVKRGALSATFDEDGEFTFEDYKVLSASPHAARLKFTDFRNESLTLAISENGDKLLIRPQASNDFGIKVAYFSGAFSTVQLDGELARGKSGTNVGSLAVSAKQVLCSAFHKGGLSAMARPQYTLTIRSSKGLRFTLQGLDFFSYDLTDKLISYYLFNRCPSLIEVSRDNTLCSDNGINPIL